MPTYEGPTITPGDIAGWPRLLISYRTDPNKVADILPPGIAPGKQPHVHLSIYQAPVPAEPEYGVKIYVDADYDGIEGHYTIGYGIDQEAAIFISRDINGQPKYPCTIDYYRMGDNVTARCTHQGYTFIEFQGQVTETLDPGTETTEDNEWWVKYSPAVGNKEKSYDFPPHVVRVRTVRGPGHREAVDGRLTLLDSPWDPINQLLPLRELLSAELSATAGTVISRDITLEGELDGDAFWPMAWNTIGGSRWPGEYGGPKGRR